MNLLDEQLLEDLKDRLEYLEQVQDFGITQEQKEDIMFYMICVMHNEEVDRSMLLSIFEDCLLDAQPDYEIKKKKPLPLSQIVKIAITKGIGDSARLSSLSYIDDAAEELKDKKNREL